MASGWCTKQDVIDDLKRMSGSATPVGDPDLIYGENAPPRRFYDGIDSEIEIMFGKEMLQNNVEDAGEGAPDLEGIKQMIRMAQDDDESEEEQIINNNTICVISKLNPNVEEFVPQFLQSSQGNFSNGCDQTLVTNPLVEEQKDDKLKQTVLDENETEEKEIALLKEKIFLSENEDFIRKKERNAAIASLFRAMHNRNRLATADKPVKLYSPEFFETCKAVDFTNTKESLNTGDDRIADDTNNTDAVVMNGITSADVSEECDTKTNLTPELAEGVNLESTNEFKDVPDEVMKKSVNIVNEWFDYKPPSIQPKPKINLDLNNITYCKRKEPNLPSQASNNEISKPAEKKFVPSQYALELRQKYEENRVKLEQSQKRNKFQYTL